ncbi:unnamed protein product [Closterium sp. NIES-65]|nr:unnamed protein product [Closterium sp. NIES-65]
MESVIRESKDILFLSYADDTYIIGPAARICEAFGVLREQLEWVRLEVQALKCRFWECEGGDAEWALPLGMQRVEEGLTVVGVPIGEEDWEAWQRQLAVEELQTLRRSARDDATLARFTSLQGPGVGAWVPAHSDLTFTAAEWGIAAAIRLGLPIQQLQVAGRRQGGVVTMEDSVVLPGKRVDKAVRRPMAGEVHALVISVADPLLLSPSLVGQCGRSIGVAAREWERRKTSDYAPLLARNRGVQFTPLIVEMWGCLGGCFRRWFRRQGDAHVGLAVLRGACQEDDFSFSAYLLRSLKALIGVALQRVQARVILLRAASSMGGINVDLVDREKDDVEEEDELIRLVREFGGKTELGSAPVDGGARAVTRIPAGTAAAYIRVKEFYLQRGLCNRMALSEELSSLKMKEGEGVAAYWARAEDLRSKYLAAGGKEEVEEWMMRVLKGLPPHFEMLKVVLNNQSSSLTKDQLLTSLRSEEMRIGVAPRSDGVATFGAGTKVGSSGRGNWVKGGKHGDSGSSSDTNSGRWGQGKGKAGVLDFPWGSKGMAPRGLCHGCWDEGHAWQRCPHRPKGGIPAFLKRGGRGSNGKAQVADEEEQDDKAEAVVGEAVAAVGEEQPREGWWIDSGASHNFTPYASDFKSKLQPPEVRGVRLGDGRVVKAVGMGEVPVVGAGGQLLRIQKVHLVLEMQTRLLSVPHLTSRDVIVTFKGKRCVLQRGERVLAIGEKERGRDHGLVRMFLPLAQGTQGSALAAKSSSSFSPLTLAHRRLGHTAPTTLQQMARGNSVLGLEIGGGNTDCSPCEPCLLGKSARKPFPHEASRALGPLDEVHMDLWGPVRTPSLGGAVYVLSLIDDFTRRVWSFPLPNKESAIVAKVLRQWHKDVELECGRKLKAVRSDRGGEFLGEAVKAWKAEFGIKTQLSVADTPQQNGVVERWHRTMAEGIRTLLVDSGLPARLWGEALMWVVWVKNRVTHSALPASITPMEAWSGQKPHVGMARIWGCMGSVMLHGHEKGGKLDARAVMCVCVGVDMESKGWRMLDPSIMRIRIARDVDFLENVMWKDWDKAKEFGELLQDAAAISQLLPLPLSPPSATAHDVEMPLSPLPPAPLSVSVQQQPTPLQQLSGPSVIQRRSATQATSSSSSSGQRSIPLSTGAPPSPATTSPPPVTGLQVLGIQSGTGGEEVGGDAGVVEGMLCLAREVEGVALAGVSTGQGGACSEVPDEGSRNGTWSTEEGVAADVKVYQSLIGSLMYAAVTTRPDMSFTVNTLAQSCVAPRRIHMRAALRALSLQLHENLERIGMRVIAAKAKASFAGGVVF